MPDHVHILVSIPPKISVSSFMGYLKGKSALMMFDKHANLKYKFRNRHFWAEGYYVSTVGLNEESRQDFCAKLIQPPGSRLLAGQVLCFRIFCAVVFKVFHIHIPLYAPLGSRIYLH